MMMIVFLIIIAHMSLIWLWYRITNNPSVVDVGWASGLTLSGLIYLSQSTLSIRTAVLGTALLVWGIRLGGYLWWTRIRPKHVDKRYTALSQSWTVRKPLGFFINFQLQGLFIFLVSISWYFISLSPAKNINLIDILGLILFIFALSLETLADFQLQRFKKNYPGQVCDQQLWRFSRHPNCFFEWLIWCSFTFFALDAPYGVLSFLSPLALYVIMVFITIPVTERESVKSRGQDYIEYQATTPQFFPKVIGFN
jgi:steroid 5-alpha reductase family enzyme